MKKRIGIILIVIGILVLAFPFANTAWMKWRQQQIINQIDDSFKALASSGNEAVNSDAVVSDSAAETDADNNAEPHPQGNRTKIRESAPDPQFVTSHDGLKFFGKIAIPVIDVTMPLVEGTSDYHIAISAGHMPDTAYPNQFGNSVIVGHRGYSRERLFNRLDELKFGDRIVITSGGVKSDYVVYNTKVVEPTDFSVIEQNGDHKLLTLITCTPLYSFEYRLIVQAVKLTD